MPQNACSKQYEHKTFIDHYWSLCMEERIHCYVLDLQMAIHKKSSQYFVGTNQISVFYLHFDVRLAFIMIVTIYNFVNFTNKLLGPFFSLSKLESKCLRFFKVSYSGVVKNFFFYFFFH